MRRRWWPVIGLGLGLAAGGLWGWWGSGAYEAGDSAIGTGLLGAVAGLLIGVVAATVAGRRGDGRR